MQNAYSFHLRERKQGDSRYPSVHPARSEEWIEIASREWGIRQRVTLRTPPAKVTGDSKLQAEGKMDRAKGKVENAVGGLKDSLRDDEHR